jgi:predicted dehydrogenase
MTSSIDEANKLYDIACKNKTLAMVGHTHLFSSAYKKLKDIAGHMGKIKKIISIGGNWGPFRKNMSMIWDYAPHDIAMCLDAFEKYPKSISAERIEYIKTEESFGESININLDFGLDAHANIHVSNVAHEKKRYFEVQCEYGDLVYNDIELESKLAIKKLDQLKPENIPIDNIKPLTYLISDFCKKIASGAEFDDSLLLGVQVVKVLDSCQTILNEANKVEQKYLC